MLSRAKNYALEFIEKNPEHKDEVNDLFQLMRDNIEEGDSVEKEIDDFISACDDLLIE